METGRKARRILVVGYNAWDTTVPFGGLPTLDAKHEVVGFVEGGGGPGATAAVALRKLGVEVRLVSPLADDEEGCRQRAELEAAGIDVSACPTYRGHRSPRAVILADETTGDRTIFWSRGDLPLLDPGSVDPCLLEGVDLLYTDGHEVAASSLLAEEARRRGIPVVMDAGSVREGSGDLVALCSDVISSRGFAPELTGEREPLAALRALRSLGPVRVGWTCGSAGVLGLDGAGPLRVPAFVVPVRDTTGAGDVFHAGYARALVGGDGFRECLEFGAAAAALSCRDWGGRGSLPDPEEVRALMASGSRLPLGAPLADLVI